jgi:hypothetical protein
MMEKHAMMEMVIMRMVVQVLVKVKQVMYVILLDHLVHVIQAMY